MSVSRPSKKVLECHGSSCTREGEKTVSLALRDKGPHTRGEEYSSVKGALGQRTTPT